MIRAEALIVYMWVIFSRIMLSRSSYIVVPSKGVFIKYGVGGREIQGGQNFFMTPPLSIHVHVLYMSLTNDNFDSCLCLIYEFDKWQFHWSTWVYTKTYKASGCKFYYWREAQKMTKLVNLFHFHSFKKFANTFHPYSMLFIYKQSYRLMRQLRYNI